VDKTADFVEAFLPEFVVMENARELIMGRQSHHYQNFAARIAELGYKVSGKIHRLEKYGLPQYRERAIVLASRTAKPRSLEDLWEGWEVVPAALTVRHAIGRYGKIRLEAGAVHDRDPMHRCPAFASDLVKRRMAAIPHDGGSWFDLAGHPSAADLLIPSMKDRLKRGDLGSHGDVYGRLAWGRPSPTIKRECGHVGNGRYAHPEQTRLLSLREMSILQGFPDDYEFVSSSLSNSYRHVGDAVPPMISFQLSAIIKWMKTGVRGEPDDWILPGTSFCRKYIVPSSCSGFLSMIS
jgi:DNA (cytosine-5)-methyltransferase 1